ncbi:hypothetical protein HMPREF9477_01759 [Lachnospiraceae bacterium 2_1_46FAA]|nr:hypothetical protein HMPREF9477_01759 [Lachnospiraceae bacterium 2_1_46FAA]
MLNEEQKKQIRQMVETGCGYRETMKCLRISRQEIVDYRIKLVEEGGHLRKKDLEKEEGKIHACGVGKNIRFCLQGERKILQ